MFELRGVRKAWATSKWPTVTGAMIESSLSSSRTFPGGGPFVVAVRYTYEVDGRVFQSERLRYGHDSFDNTYLEGAARKLLTRYSVGNPVTVRYNPADPNEAVLEGGVTGHTFLHVLVSAGFLVTGVQGFLKALQ